MPRTRKQFVPVEVEFIQLISKFIAAKTGMPRHQVIGAACEMWQECILAGTVSIDPLVLSMYFPPSALPALIEFELISETPEGLVVRGITKHLDAIQAKKEAAKTTNEKRWGAKNEATPKRVAKRPDTAPKVHERPVSDSLSGSLSDTVSDSVSDDGVAKRFAKQVASRSQNTEYINYHLRTELEQEAYKEKALSAEPTATDGEFEFLSELPKKVVEPKVEPASDKQDSSKPPKPKSAHAEVAKACCEIFKTATGSAYMFAGAKDGEALKALLAIAPQEEILRRWRLGLEAQGFAHVSTLAQLRSKWNDLANPDKLKPAGAIKPTRPKVEIMR